MQFNSIKSLGLLLMMGLAWSCKKEGVVYEVGEGAFSGSLSASPSTVVLEKAKENETAVTFNWQAASFGENTVVAYTLQLAKPADTTGGWASAKTFPVGSKVTSYAFITKDLNNLLTTMGLPAGSASELVVRVKAEVPQYNGTTSRVTPVYSNVINVTVTPYSENLYIPGAYQGWDPSTAQALNPVEGRPGLFEAYAYMPGSGPQYFKYTSARDWNHINYGDGGNGSFSTDGQAAGLSVPDGGYYELTADMNTNKWTAVKTDWGIIGDATPGGWNNDTEMTYDPVSQVWTVTADMKANGSFKFRANKAWTIDFGMDGETKELKYADNPFFGYTDGLWNLSVPEDGNYTITLDLHISQHYTYSIVKN